MLYSDNLGLVNYGTRNDFMLVEPLSRLNLYITKYSDAHGQLLRDKSFLTYYSIEARSWCSYLMEDMF